MKKNADKLKDASSEIARKIQELTSDFKFGLGTFGDKPIPPFSKAEYNNSSEKPYEFSHQMNLSSQIADFKEKISNIKFVNNVDSPEAG